LRPGSGSRPGQGGSGEQWAGWRPGSGNGPRPGGIWGNGSNNTNSGNNIANSGNTNNIYNTRESYINNNQQGFVSAGNSYGSYSGWGGYHNPGYYSRYYGGWYSGSWNHWPVYPAVWAGGAALTSLGLAASDSFTYSNPYATTVSEPVYNYSQPIPVYVESSPAQTVVVNNTPDQAPATPGLTDPSAAPPAAQAPDQSSENEDPKVKKAVGLFDQARELFKHADYSGAHKKVDEAIGVLPQDRMLHEFRALVLFAERDYSQAAGTIYAVLASGPGWNWDTLKSFYSDVDTYTRQLRALEADAKDKPKSVEDRFVLAYHYFVLGQNDAAIKELESVTRLQPEDKLSAQLLAALKPKPSGTDDRPPAEPG
jgi:tetratricopeptide (TPR) repeat protein